MGNTNLPQAGAAGTENGRDTRSGEDQLTEQEKSRQDQGGIGPAPSRPKNAPPRVPGQQRDPDDEGNVEGTGDGDHDRNDDVERPAGTVDMEHLGGYTDTGRSPSNAT